MFFDLERDIYELQNEIYNPDYQSIIQPIARKLNLRRGLAVISPQPPRGTVGQSFTFQLAARGGRRPYAWAVVQNSLPPGVTLESDTGLLTGTPTQAGRFLTAIQASDASVSPYSGQPQAHIRTFTFVIQP
jgi:hypothetical protein